MSGKNKIQILKKKEFKETSKRPKIAFFDYPDVFEDFYPHYGVTQKDFGLDWQNTANHQWLRLIQNDIGDVTWFVNCIEPEFNETRHKLGFKIRYICSGFLHRILWKTFYLPSFSWRWRRYYRLYALLASYLSPLSWQMWKALKEEKPDALFVQDYCSGRYDILLFYSYLLKIPLLTFHSGSTPDKYLGKAIRRYTLKKSDWIFPSGQNEQKMLNRKFGIRPERTVIIRPPIDTKIFKPYERSEALAATGLDRGKRYVLFVGRFEDSVKRLSTIIRVFAEIADHHPDVDLLIIGNGKDEEPLRKLASEIIPNRIIFKGWISEGLMKAMYYNLSEFLVLNSWREASPAVIGEAFACGTPVISSNVGCIKDIVIPGKSGWLFPAGEDKIFKKCLSDALQNPDIINKMRKNTRRIAVEKVSEQGVTKSLKDGFYAVLPQKKK
jgi:glycosyltransferase involved in cell wall biosynthesis